MPHSSSQGERTSKPYDPTAGMLTDVAVPGSRRQQGRVDRERNAIWTTSATSRRRPANGLELIRLNSSQGLWTDIHNRCTRMPRSCKNRGNPWVCGDGISGSNPVSPTTKSTTHLLLDRAE